MNSLPLIPGFQAEATLLWRGGRAISHAQFAGAAIALASRLPPQQYAINLCGDRGAFMLGFAAACLRGQTNLLPGSRVAGAVDDLARAYPESHVLDDAIAGDFDAAPAAAAPELAADHIAAIAFTSGSTGKPRPHPKTWRELVQTAQLARQVFLPGDQRVNVLATVPPQHMYGLETSVFFALAAGCTAVAGQPFFPADIREQLAALAPPRVLVTTPVHLRALLGMGAGLPQISLVISATAPLSAELAQRAEAALGAPVAELYGCTEGGSLAMRRTVQTQTWRLHPGMHIENTDISTRIFGDHLPGPVQIGDLVEIEAADRFTLIGRDADMLKVAGKRASLADLTLKLLAIPGVHDGVLFLPDGAERPAAIVSAEISESQIMAALAPLMDAVFLPRPLRKVQQLPRDALGKLPRAALMELLRHG